MVRCRDERWGQKESDDLGDNVTWGYTRRRVEFLKGKVNWSSNQVKEGRGEKNREVRPRTGKIYCLLVAEMKASTHIHTQTHKHIQTVYLSDVEKCLYVGSHWVSAAGVICPCLYGLAIWHEKKPWWSGFKEPYLLFQHQKVHLRASAIFHPFSQLGLGFIMMSNSLCLCHLSSCPSFDPSSFLVPLFHMLHSSFVASVTSTDIYKEKKKKNAISKLIMPLLMYQL